MVFRDINEAITALDMPSCHPCQSQGRIPAAKKIFGENGLEKGPVITTTPPVPVNDILDSTDAVLQHDPRQEKLGNVIQDCYEYAVPRPPWNCWTT
jgi:hypothetical protein